LHLAKNLQHTNKGQSLPPACWPAASGTPCVVCKAWGRVPLLLPPEQCAQLPTEDLLARRVCCCLQSAPWLLGARVSLPRARLAPLAAAGQRYYSQASACA